MTRPIQLIRKEHVAEGTMQFYFSKPEGFVYRAGQSIDITLIDPPETDAEGNTRSFSLTSAPHEEYLSIATRIRNTAFKQVLASLVMETAVSMVGPFGDMTLHNDSSKPAVFLAGGIGITPFYSIVKHATRDKLPHKIYLFYSNRRPEDTAFLTELKKLEGENPNFKLIATMTQGEKSKEKWEGEQGYITQGMLKKYVPDITSSIGYLAGPPKMITAMRKLLNDSGLDDDYIRSEEFTGY
jgi:ferredoxin-NADP reductase